MVPPPRSSYAPPPHASWAPPAPQVHGSWVPPPTVVQRGSWQPSPKTDAKAVAALILGLLSFVFGPFTGLAAIAVGAIARRDIDRSNGMLEGRGIAAGGIVTGIFGMGFVFVVVLSLCDTMLAIHQQDTAPSSTVRAEVTESR